MDGKEKHSYQFNSFRLDVVERQLLNDNTPVPLSPKAFDVLSLLVERAGHLVEKKELMQSVWFDSFVEEANLSRAIHTLRKALGEDDNGNKFIETVSKKGYRFVAKVKETDKNGTSPPHANPILVSDSSKLEQIDASAGANTFKTESIQTDNRSKKVYQRRQSRPLLVLIIGLTLVAAISGFWLVKDFRKKNTGVKNISHQTSNGEAYQHYQQGKLLLERKLKGDLKLALASFEKAIELDPNYAAAHIGKADTKIWMFWNSNTHDDISQARTSVSKALEFDETNSYAHTLLCRIKVTYDWDFDGGEKECRRAIELDPDSFEARSELAHFLNVTGREEEALAEIDTAIALTPTSFNKRSRGLILYYSRRYDEAIAQLQQVAETDQNFSMANKWIRRSYEMKNDHARAFEWHIRQVKQAGADPDEIANLNSIFNESGWHGILRDMVNPEKMETRGKMFGLTETAIMFCQIGENDRAFEYLNKAYEQRDLYLTHIKREPRLDSIRTDPRFDELIRRIGLK